jgi:hypothetical protein
MYQSKMFYFDYSNEQSVPEKGGGGAFIDPMSDHQLLENFIAVWSYLLM